MTKEELINYLSEQTKEDWSQLSENELHEVYVLLEDAKFLQGFAFIWEEGSQ